MTGKKVAILQSSYLPWKGYFDLISSVDEFIFYDDVEFSKGTWRNRNQLKGPGGIFWLTVPVITKNSTHDDIRDIRISGNQWVTKHWNAIESAYRKSPYFEEVADWLKPLLFSDYDENLSRLNRSIIREICNYLEIKTNISESWDYESSPGQTERLVSLCLALGAQTYVSGPAARNYLDEGMFQNASINVEWFDYNGYPEYPQRWGNFEHNVSVVDVLFNCGKESYSFIQKR